MLIVFFYKLMSFLLASAVFSLPAMASWTAARPARLSFSERILLAASYCLALMLLSFGVPGMLGCLSWLSVIVCCAVFSGGLHLVSRRWKRPGDNAPVPVGKLSRNEFFFLGMMLYGTVILMLSCLMGHLGTDTYFYHLFFPAMWLENGSMAYVQVPGFTCEYYPAYGEMLFGFLMAPTRNADFSCLLQPAALTLNAVAVYVLGRFFGASGTASLAAGALAMFTSMVFGNAAMAYTDVLNGALLTAGTALLCVGADRRHIPSCLGAGILLGTASAVKLTGLMLSPVISFAVMLFFFLRKKDSRKAVLVSAAAAVVFAAPFYLRSWIVTGNPFYPVRLPPFFTAGLEFERSAVGFTKAAWSFFFRGGSWGLNIPSGILWGLAPFAVLAAALQSRKFRERGLAVVLAAVMVVLFAVQLMVYPAIAEARQYIPWIMMCSTLLPIVLSPAADRFPRSFPLAVLAVVFAVYFSPVSALYGFVLIPLSGALLMLVPAKLARPGLRIGAALFFLAAAFVSTLRETDPAVRKHGNVAVFGPGPAECIRQVIRASEREGAKTTAVIGTKFSYGFMEDEPGNRVVSIPINKKNSLYPHEFESLAAMRADPVDADEWITRLDAAGADFLYVERGIEEERLPDPDWERRMASAHPERFRLLYEDELCALFRIVK